MAESMSDRIIRLYQAGRISRAGLINAVRSGLITEAVFYSLTHMTYDEAVNGKAGEGEQDE